MKQQPGYISTQLHQGIAGSTVFMNYAVWESSHIGELNRFFKWLHTTPTFGWRRGGDFEFIERAVKRLPSDRPSIQDIEIKVFSIEHLKLLYKHTLPSERLRIVWCLNCSYGAAEIVRVEWEDLLLYPISKSTQYDLTVEGETTQGICGITPVALSSRITDCKA